MKIAIFDNSFEYNIETPYKEPLGGTQSAVCYFLEELALCNNEVYLLNNNKNHGEMIRNVKHIKFSEGINYIKENNIELDIIIVVSLIQEVFKIKYTLNNDKSIYCLWLHHDVNQAASQTLKDDKAKNCVDLFMFVSEWQRKRYIEKFNINYKKTYILKNGIGKPFEKFLNIKNEKKQKSLSYCSIPWRGLELLPDIYKSIKEYDNEASLNIYAGMNIYQQEETDTYKKKFENMENVNYNYGVSQTILAEELSKIDILTYPNIFPETSCITVLQAMAVGCIIITSDLGALKETMGGFNECININEYDFNRSEYILKFIEKLKDYFIMDNNFKNKLREYNKEYIKKNYLWSNIAQGFLNDISETITNKTNYVNNIHTNTLNEFIKNFNESKWKECLVISNNINNYRTLSEYYIIQLNVAICYYKIDLFNEAKKLFKQCLELNNDYNVNKNIALMELQRNDIKKFIKYGREAIIHEFDIELCNLLAEKYELLGMYNDAIAMYETIIKMDTNNINSLNNLGNLYLLCISQIENIDEIVNKLYYKALHLCNNNSENIRKKELILSNVIFNNLYNWKLSDAEIFTRSCIWYDYFPKEAILLDTVKYFDRKNFNSKLKIGYIACDFITHPVGFMFNSILKNHNINEFDIFCYDCVDTGRKINDPITLELREYKNAQWRDLTGLSDAECLKIISNDNLDILVDMMGHTRNTRMNVLQYKPARVQISYFAYPSTNGLKEIDYRFTDNYATPPECDKYFVEKLYRLPNGFQCYTPPIKIDAIKNYENRGDFKIHLCCFNNPTKLSIPTIDTFCNILKKF